MKLKFLAIAGLMAGVMLSACSDDEVAKKPVITPQKKPANEQTAQDAIDPDAVVFSSVDFDITKTYQKVDGIGAMFPVVTWGVPAITSKQVDVLYKDYGLNIVRLYIYPDKNNWSADLALIKRAVANGAIVLACPWEAPAGMMDTQTKLVWDDGIKGMKEKKINHLKHDSYKDYANHLISYVDYMKKQGVTIYAMSVQNEPDAEFMYWSPEEIRDFVEKYGAYIAEETGVKLISPEACGMDSNYTNPIINSADAYAATDIIAGHLYQGFSNINNVHATNGYVKNRYDYINSLWGKINGDGKCWWMTEHLFNDGEKSTNSKDWVFLNWDYCLNHLALEMHDCMAASCSAYIYWYIKRFYGLIYDKDKEGRSGSNPEDSYSHNSFIMAQYAGYATGKTRIDASCDDKDIKLTAYKSDDDSELSFVAINYSNKEKYLAIDVDGAISKTYGLTCDKDSQTKQKLTRVIPNILDNKVVLTIPAMGMGSVTVVK